MCKRGKTDKTRYVLLLMVAAILLGFDAHQGLSKEMAAPTVEQLARGEGKGWLPPTIEDLTNGKVKIGDLVTKDNVDLVKEYLPPSMYECVKGGMVLRMAENLPPEKVIPKHFWEATLRNTGQAVMDENGVVRMKDGLNWAGGLCFPEPKKPLEAMANIKYSLASDDKFIKWSPVWYIDKEGKLEKTANVRVWQVQAFGRLKLPPLGTIPGYENLQFRHMVIFTDPLEMKGTGQITIRHYDEYTNPDEGFGYLPAFKRVIRVSATTFQDNVGGQDYTYGDPQGLREPFAFWNFKSIETKLMLWPEPKSAIEQVSEDGVVNPKLEFDVGFKYPRVGWVIAPVTIVDAEPKIRHIYGRKTLYMPAFPYWATAAPISLVDIYDRQGQLWKCFNTYRHTITVEGIDYGNMDYGIFMHDLQTGHVSYNAYYTTPNRGIEIDFINRTNLLRLGR